MSLTNIPLAGVIGSPIVQSRSPQVHGHWLKTYGIRGHYIPMNVAPDDLENVIRTLPRMGFVGVNVTLPHKEAVMQIADLVTDRAILIGASNTLITPITRMVMAFWKTSRPARRGGSPKQDRQPFWARAVLRVPSLHRCWMQVCLKSACPTARGCAPKNCGPILAAVYASMTGCRPVI